MTPALSLRTIATGIGAVVLLLIGWQGCSRLDANRRKEADEQKRKGELAAEQARALQTSFDSLKRASELQRVVDSIRTESALERAEYDRRNRVVEYRTITDPAALRLLTRKDTTIDSLTVVVQRKDTVIRNLRIQRDTAEAAAIKWRSAHDARVREASELRKISGPWWKERIKPRCIIGAGAGLTRVSTVELQKVQLTCGFQVFP